MLEDQTNTIFGNEVIEGWQFNATLQLRTPLIVLLHHGEMFFGPPDEAPKYGSWADGFSPDGIWVPKTKSWTQLAIENNGNVAFASKADELVGEATHSSDIGYALPSEYIPFLIQFRKIVEGDAPIPEQIKLIKALASTCRAFASILRKLARNYPGFPASFFINGLCALPGVGPKVALSLFRAGYLSIQHVQASNVEQLTSISGIGSGTAKKIFDYFENKT